ncbi:hypothetical protein [Pseudomonas sp. CGJS7]|uniref:hypothetical protein n=1 Tax=Pseudomonas sp. CGJS7 TaxID=3109348 RepID=UPI00300BD52F
MKTWILPGACALLLAACATTAPRPPADDGRSGAVGVRSIDKLMPGTDRMQLADNETFQMPLAEAGNPLPAYPAELLTQRLPPQTVCLRVAIGADGRVMDSQPIADAQAGCPDGDGRDPRFIQAARTAAAQWRFDPAFRCVYPGPKPDEQGCVTGVEQAVAVSLAFSFVFEQQDGKGTVRVGG